MTPLQELSKVEKAIKWLVGSFLKLIISIFFRDVHTRGQHKIPEKGAVIFVIAPHANQFVDPIIVINHCKRDVGFLIAQKSLGRKFVGPLARAMNSIGVTRPQDLAKKVTGTIYISDKDSLTVYGNDTNFTKEVVVGDSLAIRGGTAEILEIVSDTELKIRREFAGDTVEPSENFSEPIKYKAMPKVDQSAVYEKVFERLANGGCIGIFPEGGSHDRTELLPLKAGVTLMALGAMAANPGLDVKIVACGLNYFHAHRFRSQACVFFSDPMTIPPKYVEQYKEGGPSKREACGKLLETILDSLHSVTVNAKDYDDLLVVQAVRRLYQPADRQIPTSEKIALQIRIQEGYDEYVDMPQLKEAKESIKGYNKQLKIYGLKDHQISKVTLSKHAALFMFVTRLVRLVIFSVVSIPGMIINMPVALISIHQAKKKAKEAVAGSSVKIAGRDVLATWKVFTALAFAVLTIIFYCSLAFVYMSFYTDFSFFEMIFYTALIGISLPFISYLSVRFVETGRELYVSLNPLWYALLGGGDAKYLKSRRETLKLMIVEIVDVIGPKVYSKFDKYRYVSKEEREYLKREYFSLDSGNVKEYTESLKEFKEAVTEFDKKEKIE